MLFIGIETSGYEDRLLYDLNRISLPIPVGIGIPVEMTPKTSSAGFRFLLFYSIHFIHSVHSVAATLSLIRGVQH